MKKVIIITGGSRGIGAATAFLAARQGYAVGINYIYNRQAADRVVERITQIGGEASAIAADITKEAEVINLFKIVDERLGKLTALVNNAGILEQQMRLENYKLDRLERVFATNIIGSFLCAREAIKQMSTKYGGAGGGIVNVSSGASKTGSPNEYIDYAASKGAIDSFTIGLAKEVIGDRIRVNAVRPGIIDTDIHASGGEPKRIERVKESIPMKRSGRAIEVANAIMWLLSDEASYTTGSFIDVAGGL